MSNINFNSGGNINRFAANANPSGSGVNPQQSSAIPSNNIIMPLINSQLANNLNLLTERMFLNLLQLNLLEATDFSKLVKELLNFPKDINELLAMLAFNDNNPETMLKLLSNPDSKVLIEELQKFLTKNSKEVLNKLINLTQNNALFYEGSSQLRDILGFMQKIEIIAQKSPADALAVTMVLYLPWLPLAHQQKLELGFVFDEENSKESSNQDEAIIIFINTQHLGNFKVTIIVKNLSNIEIEIENDQLAAHKITEITSAISQELQKYGIKTVIYTLTREKMQTKPNDVLQNDSKSSVTLHPSGKISVIAINIAYNVAKIIFKFDNNQNLIKTREEKIK